MGKAGAFWIAIVVAIGLAVLGTTPPRPAPVSAPAGQFSAERAMADVRMIAQGPHGTGTEQHRWVRERLEQRLIETGLGVRQDEGEVTDPRMREWLNRYNGTKLARIPLTNTVAVLGGSDPKLPAVALMAHYDSVPGSPAAADDGAGVAAILETLRVLAADRERRRDVIVIFTDGEESGLLGAKMFFGQNGKGGTDEAGRIGAIINLEARGGGGTANLFQTSAMNGEVAGLWARTAPHPAGASLSAYIYSVLPNDTDLTPALPRGYAAWNIAFVGRPELYHSPLATADRLDRGSLQQMGEQTLGLAQALVRAEALPGKAPDAVFFDVFGLFAVHYAPVWGWAMLALGAAGYALLGARDFALRPFLGGIGRMVGLIVLAAAVLQGLNLLSQGAPVDYYDRLAATTKLEAMALFVCIDIAFLFAVSGPTTRAGEAGFALPLLLLGAAGQALAPTAAYVLALPLALGGLAALPKVRESRAGMAVSAVMAALVGGYMLVLGHFGMQAVGAMMPVVAVLPLALVCLLFLPLRPLLPAIAARLAAGAFLLLAVGMALWVRWDAPAPTVPIYSQVRELGVKG
ncbi:M20/M25/M40 family metallo-hydrolase [Novosphingobium resinovorum]|uniref:M20/M25/M40 family metallo-hydrolase n=1 Tax=Novosphingobium resinovorum TaxID=158500 RepID=UPI002ED031F0|nr:M20/M25/M40 family metallo-hydrolase [Novosphingobium resinovorum]